MADSSPVVSVLVPAFNSARFLRESVESVLSQTFSDLELIVVDDGSVDETVSILEEYRSDQRVRIERQEHLGLRTALELGRRVSQGALLARHDSDDLAMPDRIEKQVAFLDAHPDVVAVGGATELVDASGRPFSRGTYPLDHDAIVALLPFSTALADPATMIRRDAMDAVGGWRTTMKVAGDYDLQLRLAEVGQLANLPDTLVRYRVHPGQISGTRIQECAHTSLAAFAAATARASGNPDPLDGVTAFDTDLMRRLGVSDDRVVDFTLDLTIWWAKLVDRAGDPAGALDLWRQARRLAGRDRSRLRQVLAAQRRIRSEQDRPWHARLLHLEELVRAGPG